MVVGRRTYGTGLHKYPSYTYSTSEDVLSNLGVHDAGRRKKQNKRKRLDLEDADVGGHRDIAGNVVGRGKKKLSTASVTVGTNRSTKGNLYKKAGLEEYADVCTQQHGLTSGTDDVRRSSVRGYPCEEQSLVHRQDNERSATRQSLMERTSLTMERALRFCVRKC